MSHVRTGGERRSAMGQGVLTGGFSRAGSDASVHCEGVPIEEIARDVGTPVYVYSAAVIRDRYERLASTLSTVPHRIHYTAMSADHYRVWLGEPYPLGARVPNAAQHRAAP